MENIIFLCYPNCSTCAKARKYLERCEIDVVERDIKKSNPTYAELEAWWKRSGLPLIRFFNTSGQTYRSLGLKGKLPTMTDEEKLMLLASDGMLVRRPLLVLEDTVLVGFSEDKWEEALI